MFDEQNIPSIPIRAQDHAHKPTIAPSTVAALSYWHFFGDDHPFPGPGYALDTFNPTYTDGCAVGCLIDPALRPGLDNPRDADPDDDELDYPAITTLFENHPDRLLAALQQTFDIPSGRVSTDIVVLMRNLQQVHDRHAGNIASRIEDKEDPSNQIAALKTDFEAALRMHFISPEAVQDHIDVLREKGQVPAWIGQTANPSSYGADA